MSTQVFPPFGVKVPPPPPDVQDFTSSGTWTKPEGAKWIVAELIGAGGGADTSVGGAGGGGAAYNIGVFSADSLGATETVTVGAGAPISHGGDSSFASLVAQGGRKAPNATTGGAGGGFGGAGTASSGAAGGDSSYGGGGGTYYFNAKAGSSEFGGGGGNGGYAGGTAGSIGLGGTLSDSFGRLKAGNGGAYNAAGQAPGGGSGGRYTGGGAAGAVRITTYF